MPKQAYMDILAAFSYINTTLPYGPKEQINGF